MTSVRAVTILAGFAVCVAAVVGQWQVVHSHADTPANQASVSIVGQPMAFYVVSGQFVDGKASPGQPRTGFIGLGRGVSYTTLEEARDAAERQCRDAAAHGFPQTCRIVEAPSEMDALLFASAGSLPPDVAGRLFGDRDHQPVGRWVH